ncbi:MarR family transcriptional regulator, partial [Helicobacter suis]|uniref:MarR family transcriptional regulator n=1 Tax=Helicobacter suis TaxID=104628 RepID=UPI0019674A53
SYIFRRSADMNVRDYDPDTSAIAIPLEIFSAGLNMSELGLLTYLYGCKKNLTLSQLASYLYTSPYEVFKALKTLMLRGYVVDSRIDISHHACLDPTMPLEITLTLPKDA